MISRFIAYIKSLPLLYSIGGGAAIVAVLVLGFHFATRSTATSETPVNVTHVKIASVASLSSASGPLPLTGKVASRGQATILAQTSGEIISLSRALGDRVQAGQVIAQFENSSQQAAVVQAQGSYAAAQASLEKAQGTTATNSGISSAQAAQAAQNAVGSVQAALQSTYAALDDAVHTKADQFFSNPRGNAPTLISINISDTQVVLNAQNERLALEPVLAKASALASATTSVNVDESIDSMSASALTVETFLNTMIQGFNAAVPSQSVSASTIAADQAILAAARTEVVAAISGLSTAKNSYDAAQSGAQSAANSASTGTNSDIALAQANVQQALGALQSAKAALDKTIVRSPISGTIVSLPVTQGDFVSAFSNVAQVSNPSALEIQTNVTPDDAKTISVGGSATIDGNVKGVITSIAPAIDPSTGQIQVKIGIVSNQAALTDGDTVSLTLDRSVSGSKQSTTGTTTAFTIPIVAAKITPAGPIVFTVASSTLVANPITFGMILGDRVTVTAGLSQTMDIVSDARGLSEGEQVIVDTQ